MLKMFLFGVLATVFFFVGCKKRDECQPETYYYNFKNNAKVDTTTSGGITALRAFAGNGSKTVFIYLHAHSPCLDVIDGFVSYRLIFEVDPQVSKFKFYNDDLIVQHCYFTYETDGSSIGGAYIPSGGIIEGVKISEQVWKVNFDLKLKNNQPLGGSGTFKMQ